MQLVRKFCPLLLELPLNQLSALNPIGVCKTVSGPSPNQKCILPFSFNGVTYQNCPKDPDDSSLNWCSTKVDQNGQHITGIGAYGYCSNGCPKHIPKNSRRPQASPRINNAVEICPRSGESCQSNVICSAQLSSIGKKHA